MYSIDDIVRLIRCVSEYDIGDLEVESGSFRLKISKDRVFQKKASEKSIVVADDRESLNAIDEVGKEASGVSTVGKEGVSLVKDEEVVDEEQLFVVTSPIVGTFYRSPKPGAPPFVEVGDRVQKGQVLCIIEAMKLMNEIESEVEGTVVKIYPDNAQPVEYGDPLFAIKLD